MNLFHFTAFEYLPKIAVDGLWKGDVPPTASEGMNAVWLTSDPQPDGHGLTDGAWLTGKEKRLLGIPLERDVRFPDKRAVRLTVRVSSSDKRLKSWLPWARKRLDPRWLTRLDLTGKGKSRSWFIYFGVLPPASIMRAENLRGGGCISLRDTEALKRLADAADAAAERLLVAAMQQKVGEEA